MINKIADPVASAAQFASDVQYYLSLSPRQLPSRYFYDELGSALFDAICRLPWYGVTRAELRLLTTYGRQILGRVPGLTTIVELGPGNGEKLGALVTAGRSGTPHLDLRLVDISAAALDLSSQLLSALPNVDIATYEAEYEAGLASALAETRSGRALTLFLGSNIGNFDRPGAAAFLRDIRGSLMLGDMLLVGVDLVKPPAICCSRTTIRSASRRRSTAICSCASTANSAAHSTSTASRIAPSGRKPIPVWRCTW